ncbi:hypothetical protein PIB30_088482 [Stylosanthes scabra]|uniref:Uncharacterized protein n=1 Tax=Stylosanthes scabra TaxID=79078 RepID=A0ABU6TT84_9FABA|nr:hypothetical protein [Stylosanthes scabra]
MAMAKVGVKEEIIEFVHKIHDDNEVANIGSASDEENGSNSGRSYGKEGSDAYEDEDYVPKDEESDSDDDSWSDDSRDADEVKVSVVEVDFGDSNDDKEVTVGLFDVHISSGAIQFERG